MEVAFSGINIYSKKPEAVFEFYKKLGFRVLEEVARMISGTVLRWLCKMETMRR